MLDLQKLQEQRAVERAVQWRLLRRIWEAILPEERERFTDALAALVKLDAELRSLTPLLSVREIQTDDEPDQPFLADETLPEDMRRAGLLFVAPGEYLAAIACWEAGRDYVRPEPGEAN